MKRKRGGRRKEEEEEEESGHDPLYIFGLDSPLVVEAPELCGGFVSKCSNGDGAQPGQSGRATHWAIGEH